MEQSTCSKSAVPAAVTTKVRSRRTYSNSNKMIIKQKDRLSPLPDAILHHILSFLDMREVVSKSTVSKRWRYLWTSVPCLNFNQSLWEKITKKKDKRTFKNGFMNFVDRVLFLRDASNISKIVFSCGYFSDAERVDAWLTIAARRHVEEILLDWSPVVEPAKELSHFIFTAAIAVFDLKLNGCHGTIQLPNSMCSAPHLKTLNLESVNLPKGNISGEVLLICPVLENLAIKDCRHGEFSILNINTPHLRNLVVRNFAYWRKREASNGSCKIKICTPKLESIKLKGSLYKEYSVELLPSVVTAEFSVDGDCVVPTLCLRNVLQGIRHAKTIQLSGWLLENLSDPWPITFSNLRCLKLTGCSEARSLSSMLHLLRNSPSVETLVMEVNQGSNAQDWGEVLLPNSFFLIQDVEVGTFRGREDELKFLEHLLKYAIFLHKLTIKFEHHHYNRESLLRKFGARIQSLPRAFSSVTIILI